MATPMEDPTIDEEEDENLEDEEWKSTNDLNRLKTLRGASKSTHTKSRRKLLQAIADKKERETINIHRSLLVRDFEEVDARNARYVQLVVDGGADLPAEQKWLSDVIQFHNDALKSADDYLLTLPSPSVAGSSRSHQSHLSATSSTRLRLLESERLARENDLEAQQLAEEQRKRQEEDDRLTQLNESQRKEKERIETERKKRQLENTAQRHRQNAAFYRSQLDEEQENSQIIPPMGNPSTVTPALQPDQVDPTTVPVQLQSNPASAEAPSGPLPRVTGARNGPDAIDPSLDVFGAQHGSNARGSPPGVFGARPEPPLPSSAHFVPRFPLFVPSPASAPPNSSSLRPSAASFVPFSGPSPAKSPDKWIYELGTPSAGSIVRSSVRPPKTELPKFDGDPRKWPMFVQSFKIQVHDALTSDSDRLVCLHQALSPDIKSILGDALLNPGLYNHALQELHRRFGNPQLVAQMCSSTLLELKAFKDGDTHALRSFSAKLHSVVATLLHGGYGNELYSSTILRQLVDKLPPILRSKWADISWSLQPRLPNVIDFDSWLDNKSMAEFCLNTDKFLQNEKKSSQSGKESKSENRGKPPTHSPGSAVFSSSKSSTPVCPLCTNAHSLHQCKKFKSSTMEQRVDVVREKKCCIRCLSDQHLSFECSRTEPCKKDDCTGRHHPLLHGAPRIFPPTSSSGPPRSHRGPPKLSVATAGSVPAHETTGTSAATSLANIRYATHLPVVPVLLRANGRSLKIFALLDTGSDFTVLRSDVAKKLALNGPAEWTTITTVSSGPQGVRTKTQRVSVRVTSLDGSTVFDLEGVTTVSTLNLKKKEIDVEGLVRDWPHLVGIALPSGEAADVSMIIGEDNPDAIEFGETRSDPSKGRTPRAVQTPFGWCLVGPLCPPDESGSSLSSNHIAVVDRYSVDEQLSNMTERFFSMDLLGTKPDVTAPICEEEKRAYRIMAETVQFDGTRYSCGLLWRSDVHPFPDNRAAVLRRFLALEKRLVTNPKLAERYVKTMEETISLGFARKLSQQEADGGATGGVNYLPHHAVTNPNKPDKCRVVMNAAAVFENISLNSMLMRGPDLLVSLLGILLRSRQHRFILGADIVKMFSQVRVQPEDAAFQRFLWRRPGSADPIAVYQMEVQMFGATSSPAICAYVLRRAAEDSGEQSAIATHHVLNHFYVDNWLVSFPTEEEAIEHGRIVITALARGGFQLSQFGSSSAKVLAKLTDKPSGALNLDLDQLPVERTLGITLNFATDCFEIKVVISSDGKTKREILRAIASIFDPLGFFAALLLPAKLIMQQVCRLSVGWDDPLDADIISSWKEWSSSLSALDTLKIKRCVFPERPNPVKIELHSFADASEKGFGAIVYIRFVYKDEAYVSFQLGKSRVSPLKTTTIPRQELCAALMAVRLTNLVRKQLQFQIDDAIYWTDSTTVLRWIFSATCRYHIYVGNRVGEIMESTEVSQWHYVPSALNPADDASRGLSAADFSPNHRYLTGPEFLLHPPDQWPTFPVGFNPATKVPDPELRNENWLGATGRNEDDETGVVNVLMAKFSRLSRLIRVVGYVRRWAVNYRRSKLKQEKRVGELLVSELQSSLHFLIRHVQQKFYWKELVDLREGHELDGQSNLLTLTPYIDRRGILVVGGRIGNAPLPLDTRHPIILPSKSRLTELIIMDLHQQFHHSSTERTFHELRKLYWVAKGRITVGRSTRGCMLCKRLKVPALAPMMAALPASRLHAGLPAFAHCGVDYFGPIEVIIFRRRVKRWVSLFTCFSTRAVHFELAYALSTDSFISCLDRFEALRGTPSHYYSDNGTNFVGAVNELEGCLQHLDHSKISNTLGRRFVKWSFNPPAAPHFGGAWERLVRSAKQALKIVLNHQTLTDEVLQTALRHVQSLMNGRPLTYVSVDPADPEPLTPNHILLLRANATIAPDEFSSADMSSTKKWRFSQALATHFWRRWMQEYVPNLIERRKWLTSQPNLKEDDVVIVIDPNTPRGEWPLGRVLEVFLNKDGVVHQAIVRVGNSKRKLPVIKLCLLEAADPPEPPPEPLESSPASVPASESIPAFPTLTRVSSEPPQSPVTVGADGVGVCPSQPDTGPAM